MWLNPWSAKKNASDKRRLLKTSAANNCLTLLTNKFKSKQCGPRTDCSYRSILIWVHTVCHRGFLNISADEKSRRLLLTLKFWYTFIHKKLPLKGYCMTFPQFLILVIWGQLFFIFNEWMNIRGRPFISECLIKVNFSPFNPDFIQFSNRE